MSIASDEKLHLLTGRGAGDECTIGASDITFAAGAPCVGVLVLAGSGALSWTTPDGTVSTWGDGAYPLTAGGDVLTICAQKIHGTGGTSPASAALTIRVST